MRRAAAISLVCLGGGIALLAASRADDCRRQAPAVGALNTEQSCQSSHGGHAGGYFGNGGGARAESVTRGGFGFAGHSAFGG